MDGWIEMYMDRKHKEEFMKQKQMMQSGKVVEMHGPNGQKMHLSVHEIVEILKKQQQHIKNLTQELNNTKSELQNTKLELEIFQSNMMDDTNHNSNHESNNETENNIIFDLEQEA